MITDPMEGVLASIEYARSKYGLSDLAMQYQRRLGPNVTIEPPAAAVELGRELDALLARIFEGEYSDYFDFYIDGSTDPQPVTRRGDPIETEEEWKARVTELATTQGIPDDLGRALTASEMAMILGEDRDA